MNNLKFNNEPLIFTTGAFLMPMKVVDSKGKEQWLWVVSEFTDDSYFDGNVYNPSEFANSKEKLIAIAEEE